MLGGYIKLHERLRNQTDMLLLCQPTQQISAERSTR